ncbi:MAG: hypothetical protein K0S58_1027, partial [Nitrospira sp.]|nr:hypothetical protein [Nitrospira sp.]
YSSISEPVMPAWSVDEAGSLAPHSGSGFAGFMRQERPVSSVTVAAPCGHPIGVCSRKNDGLFSACE